MKTTPLTEKAKKTTTSKGFTIQKYIFLIAILIIPILNWVLFWLVVNVQSIVLAFKDAVTNEFTWYNFEYFWDELTVPTGKSVWQLATR